MTKKKRKFAALALDKKQKPDTNLQAAGPRSSQSGALNYMSVTTVDPSRLAQAFANADQGFISDQAQLFELIEEQDTHVFSELSKRRRAITGLGWQLAPPDDATQSELDRIEELDGMVRGIPHFEDAHYDITDAVGKGFAALEIDWRTGSEWVPQALNFVPQRHFQTDDNRTLQYLKVGMPEPLRPGGWIVHEHKAKSGYIEQAALFRVLAWTYAYKAYNTRDLQRFLEVYGLPLRLGKYPSGIGEKQRNELLRAVRNIGNDGAGVVPSTMSIDFIQAQAGKVDDFINAVAYWEQKQSMAITGGDLDGKTASEARIMIYDKVRREILLHDVRQIAPTMDTQLVEPIVAINGMFAPDRRPRWTYLTEENVDQGKMVEVLTKAAGMGLEIDLDWAHKAMQIPRAGKGAVLLGAKKKAPGGNAADAALVRLSALVKEAQDGDVTGAYAAQLAALCAPHEQAMIQQIAAAVAEAGSFDEAIASIEALSITPASKEWGEVIAKGMAAANMAARADVEEGG